MGDGEWHYAVVELSENEDFKLDETQDEYCVNFIRLGWASKGFQQVDTPLWTSTS